MRKAIWIVAVSVFVLVVAMQFHRPDYNLSATNPSATFEAVQQANPQIGKMLQRACYDCHSTQGKIPWYGQVWPAGQLLQSDVRRGRAQLDFSNWDNLSPEMSRIKLLNACAAMRKSKMPLWYYQPMHPGSKPNAGDVDAFCNWAQSLPSGLEVVQLH